MRNPSITISIDAPPKRVWAVMADVERWHEWTASVTSIHKQDAAPLAVGSRALVRQPKLPPAMWTVTEWEEGKQFTWQTSSPGMKITAKHAVQSSAEGSLATLSLQYEGILGGIIAWLYRGLTERYLQLEANGLKQRSIEK